MAAANRVSREQRLEQVRAWLESGLPCKAFARRAGVKPSTLAWWKWKFVSEGVRLAPERPNKRNTQKGPSVPFVEITPALPLDVPPPKIELELGEVTLRVPDGFDPRTLERVLELLRAPR